VFYVLSNFVLLEGQDKEEPEEEEIDQQKLPSVTLSLSNSGSNSPNLFLRSNSTLHSEENSHGFYDKNRSDDSNISRASHSIDQTLLQNTSPPIVNCCQIFHAGTICYIPASVSAPSRNQVISTMLRYNIESTDNGNPFWSKTADLVKLNELKGTVPIIRSRLISSLPDFGQEIPNHSKISRENVSCY